MTRSASLLLVLIALTGCAKSSEGEKSAPPVRTAAPASPDWTSAFKHTERWDAARSAVVADLEIAPGFHAYTTGETVGKPLAMELDESGDYVADGAVSLPAGTTKDLPLGRSVIVEGKTEVVARAKPKAATGGVAKGTLKYQVCTEKACDRPRSVPFSIAVTP
jgi:hypothetical protein